MCRPRRLLAILAVSSFLLGTAHAQPVLTSSTSTQSWEDRFWVEHQKARNYREAWLRWEATAKIRLEKNKRCQRMLTSCDEQRAEWMKLASIPKEEAKNETPTWVWPTVSGVGILSFALGLYLGVKK